MDTDIQACNNEHTYLPLYIKHSNGFRAATSGGRTVEILLMSFLSKFPEASDARQEERKTHKKNH